MTTKRIQVVSYLCVFSVFFALLRFPTQDENDEDRRGSRERPLPFAVGVGTPIQGEPHPA